ncbi:MAG: hypothetical protein ACFCVD_09940 [Nodosilinea sp.]
MMDGVESCQTSANFMLRRSDRHTYFCGACAEVGDRGAKDCASMGNDAPTRACAEMCRRYAETCRDMGLAMA